MDALRLIWAELGGDPAALERVSMVGADEVLPGAFRVTELAAGAVGAAVLAAAELRREADGVAHEVEVDRRHAAVAFRSERHVAVDGEVASSAWDAASGYYDTADGGLVQTHCNFAHHREGVLNELGLRDPGDALVADAIRDAIAGRQAAELEDALAARGMVASRLRTPEEWADHPHGQSVADLPLIEIVQIGDAPAEPLSGGPQAMSKARVIDLTRVIAGPVCGRTLAAHGADVLRVGASHLPVIDPLLPDTNLGKRWTNLDLRESGDAARFRALACSADVVVQGYRPGGIDGLGFGPESLAKMRPGIICASLSAYSHVGPWSTRRGFDSLVQTATGIGAAGAAAAGVGGTRPLPAQALDHGAGWVLAAGVMEALRRRATIGGSWMVRTSLVQVRTFLCSLGEVGAIDTPDPGASIEDLIVHTGDVAHIALPGRIDGVAGGWSSPGSRSPIDDAAWLT